MSFAKASKKQSKLRMALMGPSGSGKTYSALAIASGLGSRVAVIDSERGSASKYASDFDFDTCALENFHPDTYVKHIKEAEAAGYDVLIIDSISHAWAGEGGVLDIVDQVKKKGDTGGNGFAAWKSGTPIQNKFVEAILRARCHVIVTMRSKMEHVLERDSNGKSSVRKVGMAPVQRNDIEYEFDVAGTLSSNDLVVEKTRCKELNGKVIHKPDADLGKQLRAWLDDGAPEALPLEQTPKALPAAEDDVTKAAIARHETAMSAAGDAEALNMLGASIGKDSWLTPTAIMSLRKHFAKCMTALKGAVPKAEVAP